MAHRRRAGGAGLLLSGLRRAGVRRRLRVTQVTRRPRRAIWRQLAAKVDPSPQVVQEAGAVVSQVIGDEFAWQPGVRRGRRSGRMTRSKIHPHLVWKLWKNSGCGTAGARWAFERAVRRLYDARPDVESLERGTCGKNLGKSANFCSPFRTSVSVSPFVRRRPACEALN
jgi:hypothetical protein